jgi:glycerol kinase
LTAISGDQNAATFGAGQLTAGTALVNFGSGAFVLGLLPHYQASKKQLNTIACSENGSVQYVCEGTVNGAGSALTWLEEKQGINDLWKRLPGWLKEADKNRSGQPLLFINSVGGLGSPWWNNTIEPEFIITDATANKPETDLASQAIAVIESIVFMVCINLEIMRRKQTLTRLRVSGGLSRLDGLCQRLADVSALPVERTNQTETTARGIAWLAAGRPGSWSRNDFELFHPEDNTVLRERYAMFSTTLNNLNQGGRSY